MPLLTAGGGQGFCVNLSVDTSSVDIMSMCREIGALYIDTVVEPWLGFYFDKNIGPEKRSNYALRETLLAAKHKSPGGTDRGLHLRRQSRHGVLVRQAGAARHRARHQHAVQRAEEPRGLGPARAQARRQGHPYRRARHPALEEAEADERVRQHLVGGGLRFRRHAAGRTRLGHPREHGCRTTAASTTDGCGAAIYLLQPGANTRVRSWCPTPGAQYGFLVTHNESISIADYFTVRDGGKVVYRPTCHYAYHPANDAVLSLHEMFGATGKMQPKWHILDENEIEDGIDELGVLLYGHGKNAYWYGSQLSIEETREIAPYQNATGMQVSSAVLAGMVWALENPTAGIVEADEMDFRRCLEIQRPYLGPVKGYYTDWTPLTDRPGLFPEDIDTSRSLAVQERAGAVNARRAIYFWLIGGAIFSAGAGGSAALAPSLLRLRHRGGRVRAPGVVGRSPPGLDSAGARCPDPDGGEDCSGCVACAICGTAR